jgi:hypothetical protein
MGIDHRRTDILVTKQFLNRPDIVTFFQQMRSKGMAKCMTPDPFDDIRFEDSCFNGALQKGLMDVISAFLSGLYVFPPVFLRESPLPDQVQKLL